MTSQDAHDQVATNLFGVLQRHLGGAADDARRPQGKDL